MKLMPIPGVRTCVACEHRWFTAHVDACVCPKCSALCLAPDVWPHSCSAGHAANHGGTCERCAAVANKETNGVSTPTREWKNR